MVEYRQAKAEMPAFAGMTVGAARAAPIVTPAHAAPIVTPAHAGVWALNTETSNHG